MRVFPWWGTWVAAGSVRRMGPHAQGSVQRGGWDQAERREPLPLLGEHQHRGVVPGVLEPHASANTKLASCKHQPDGHSGHLVVPATQEAETGGLEASLGSTGRPCIRIKHRKGWDEAWW